MASCADLINHREKCISVAIQPKLDQFLNMTRCLALAPQLITAPAEIAHLPRAKGFPNRVRIHPCEHQNLSIVELLRDRRDQSRVVEFAGRNDRIFHRHTPVVAAGRRAVASGTPPSWPS